MYHFAYISLFIYFGITQYRDGREFGTISLDPSKRDCEEIPNSYFGTYQVDVKGLYDSNELYYANLGIYTFEFNEFSSKSEDYQKSVLSGAEYIKNVSDKVKYLNVTSFITRYYQRERVEL